MSEDEMVGWHHRLNEHKLEQALGDGDGQGSLHAAVQGSQRVRHDLVAEQQNSTIRKYANISWNEEIVYDFFSTKPSTTFVPLFNNQLFTDHLLNPFLSVHGTYYTSFEFCH